MIVKNKEDRRQLFPQFSLSGIDFKVCDEAKYLGYYITENLSDDRDIYRQCRMICAQANMLIC